MRAVIVDSLTGPKDIKIEEVVAPEANKESILVDVHAVGVAFPDLLLTHGKYQFRPEVPFIPGGELSGIVRSASKSSRFKEGDRVIALTGVGGAMAERVSLAEENVFPLPDSVSLSAGAGILFNYLTMHFAYRYRGYLSAGETVLVHGAAGGIGTAAIALAKSWGAIRTIAVVSSEEKAEHAKSMGATDTVLVGDWLQEVLSITEGRGVDIVVDPVGGDRFTDSVRALSIGGRILVMGFTGGNIPEVKVNRLLLKNASVIGAAWGSWWMEEPSRLSDQWKEMYEFLECGKLTVPEPTKYRFEEASQALTAIENRGTIGKIVLEGW